MFALQVLLGRVCTIADLHKKDLPVAVRGVDKAIFDFASTRRGTDHVANDHLRELLSEISNAGGGELLPLAVEGCGFCLTHSLSKFLFGIEIFYHVIRSKIHLELAENAAWYLGRSNPKSDNCNSSAPSGNFLGNFIRNSAAGILIGTEPHEGSHLYPAFTTEEYDDLLSAAVPTYADQAEWSPFDHCQMISNILKRPICLFSALSDLNKGESFTFLPLRHPPEECYKYPISIAWQSRGKDNSLSHFVPLCRVDDTSAPVIPTHCQPPLYRCTKEIAAKYIHYNDDYSFSIGVPVRCCDIESTHLLRTMGCRFKPHRPNQPGFFHGLIDKLFSSACAELSSENVLGDLFSLCSFSDEKKIDFDLGKGAIAIDLLIKLYVSRIGFDAVTLAVTTEKITEPTVKGKSKILSALQEISKKVLSEYSEFNGENVEPRNNFKLELDQHVIVSMQSMLSLAIVRDSVRAEYIQYLLSHHINQLIQNEFEKFYTKLSEKITAHSFTSSSSSSSSSSPVQSCSLSSLSSSSSTSSSPLKLRSSKSSSRGDIAETSNDHIINSTAAALSDLDLITLECVTRCMSISTKNLSGCENSLRLKLTSSQLQKCSRAISQSTQCSAYVTDYVLDDSYHHNNFPVNDTKRTQNNIFHQNSMHSNDHNKFNAKTVVSDHLFKKRKVENTQNKYNATVETEES